jgi:hypothetical protein
VKINWIQIEGMKNEEKSSKLKMIDESFGLRNDLVSIHPLGYFLRTVIGEKDSQGFLHIRSKQSKLYNYLSHKYLLVVKVLNRI